MEQRKRMVELWERGARVTDLALQFEVSRETIYEWVRRWVADEGLEDRSRRPHTSPRKTPLEVERALLSMKDEHPDYGPDKLVVLLREQQIDLAAPTARDILRRYGRVQERRVRVPRWSPARAPLLHVPGPGHAMSADYKGQFRLGDRRYCYPLTIADPASKFVFAVDAMANICGREAKRVFERVFREWGLPDQIITDNGAPFSVSQSIGAISELGRWWMRLGIEHARIQPGRPQQNGSHERMHRTLKDKTIKPPEKTMRRQQERFDAFRTEFNEVRPHQSLGQTPPARRVSTYRRPFPERLPEIDYPSSFTIRRVRSNGCIKWHGSIVFVGEVLIGEPVGLVQSDTAVWELYFGSRLLAEWDAQRHRWVPPAAL